MNPSDIIDKEVHGVYEALLYIKNVYVRQFNIQLSRTTNNVIAAIYSADSTHTLITTFKYSYIQPNKLGGYNLCQLLRA